MNIMTDEELRTYYEDILKKTEESHRQRRKDFRATAEEAQKRDAWHVQIQPHELLTILDALDKAERAEQTLAEIRPLIVSLQEKVQSLIATEQKR